MQPSVTGFICCNLHTNSHSSTILTQDTIRTMRQAIPELPYTRHKTLYRSASGRSRDVSILSASAPCRQHNLQLYTALQHNFITATWRDGEMSLLPVQCPYKNVYCFEVNFRCNQLVLLGATIL